ncbi:MAG: HEAT repeat domain-containing protein [Planctomycetota bacterium]|jgi:hypothetical protein
MKTYLKTCFLLSALAIPSPAQEQDPRPEKWPKLSDQDRRRMRFQLRQLEGIEGSEEEQAKAAKAEEVLSGMGAGITLEVLRQLDDEDEDKVAALERVLDAVLSPEYGPLVARLVRRKEAAVRIYAVSRLARNHQAEMAAVFRETLEDDEEDVRFYAALGLGGLADMSSMKIVFDRCRKDWNRFAAVIKEVLSPTRSEASADWVLATMDDKDPRSQVVGLRLLRSLAPPSYKTKLQTYLDAEQNAVKKAAINALRVVVDGEPPLEKLSVFQSIELAEKWRQR